LEEWLASSSGSRLFYYLRIFRPTSSFIRMIIEMFKDIRIFLLIFFIGIFAFANFYYILDQGNSEKVVGVFEGSYGGAVIYTYMQALGELGYDGFGGSEFPSSTGASSPCQLFCLP